MNLLPIMRTIEPRLMNLHAEAYGAESSGETRLVFWLMDGTRRASCVITEAELQRMKFDTDGIVAVLKHHIGLVLAALYPPRFTFRIGKRDRLRVEATT